MTAPAAPAVVGEVLLEKRRVNDTWQMHATYTPNTAALGLDLLQEALAGRVNGVRVLDDQLTLTMANGTWVYRIGEYHPPTRGLVLRLIHGKALTTT